MPTKRKAKSVKKKGTVSSSSRPKSHVASVAVVVSDRKKATEWYTRNLGLDLIESMDHWVAVGRKGKGGLLHLCAIKEWNESGSLEPGNSGILLRLPGRDFVAACEQLKANGVEFTEGPTKESWGWTATVRDPDGNEIFLAPDL